MAGSLLLLRRAIVIEWQLKTALKINVVKSLFPFHVIELDERAVRQIIGEIV